MNKKYNHQLFGNEIKVAKQNNHIIFPSHTGYEFATFLCFSLSDHCVLRYRHWTIKKSNMKTSLDIFTTFWHFIFKTNRLIINENTKQTLSGEDELGCIVDIMGCDEPDGFWQIIFHGLVHVLLQQLFNVPFRYWTCQHTVVWVPAPRHASPSHEYYWENGVKLDHVCNRVKHLGRKRDVM